MGCMPMLAQDVPVADLQDVEFNTDGTVTDVSPMANPIEFYGEGVSIAYSSVFGRNVATFTNTWSKAATGYYKMNFEENETFRGNGWSGEVAIARVCSKPLTQDDVTYLWNKVLDPTGIEEVSQNETATTKPSGIFTINDIRVEKTQQGIYIINGKKILVK